MVFCQHIQSVHKTNIPRQGNAASAISRAREYVVVTALYGLIVVFSRSITRHLHLELFQVEFSVLWEPFFGWIDSGEANCIGCSNTVRVPGCFPLCCWAPTCPSVDFFAGGGNILISSTHLSNFNTTSVKDKHNTLLLIAYWITGRGIITLITISGHLELQIAVLHEKTELQIQTVYAEMRTRNAFGNVAHAI